MYSIIKYDLLPAIVIGLIVGGLMSVTMLLYEVYKSRNNPSASIKIVCAVGAEPYIAAEKVRSLSVRGDLLEVELSDGSVSYHKLLPGEVCNTTNGQ